MRLARNDFCGLIFPSCSIFVRDSSYHPSVPACCTYCLNHFSLCVLETTNLNTCPCKHGAAREEVVHGPLQLDAAVSQL